MTVILKHPLRSETSQLLRQLRRDRLRMVHGDRTRGAAAELVELGLAQFYEYNGLQVVMLK